MHNSPFPDYSQMNQWSIVCGHALFRAAPFEEELEVEDPENWYGIPGPVSKRGRKSTVRLLLEHIDWGRRQLERSEKSILVFSGCRSRGNGKGQTVSGMLRSEAESYFDVAIRRGLDQRYWSRVVLDDGATTSLENIAKGCAAAFEVCQNVPDAVSLCTFKGKIPRFEHHIRTLGLGPLIGDLWPRAAGPVFDIEGIGDEFAAGIGTEAGEEDTMKKFRDNSLGLEATLSRIRFDNSLNGFRNPFLRPLSSYIHSSASWPQLHGQLVAAYEASK